MKQHDLFDRLSDKDEPPAVLTVSELTGRIRKSLEGTFPNITVLGEISNLRRPASGHIYFTLKDEKAQLRIVMFRGMQRELTFDPEDGLSVRVSGDISVYAARGEYQLIARGMTPDGVGALQQAFIKLKEKLTAEGLFDDDHKKPIPAHPTSIAIVTSETGAAIRDMLRMIRSRSQSVNVTLYPVRVQGQGSGAEIAEAIDHLNTIGGFDTIITGRGGGSIEDLWAFNEEVLARAIYASKIPVISAVGHEIDITISDLVADRRALTPTEAGDIVVPDTNSLLREIAIAADAAASALTRILDRARNRLRLLGGAIEMRKPIHLLREKMQRLDDTAARMTLTMSHRIELSKQRLAALSGKLQAISPVAVLERGYTVTLNANGKAIQSAATVTPGEEITTILAKGKIISNVNGVTL